MAHEPTNAVMHYIRSNVLHLKVRGSMTYVTVPELASILDLQPPDLSGIDIDLSEVRYIDSTGLGFLLVLQQHLAPGARCTVSGCRNDVHLAIRRLNLDKVLTLIEEAVDPRDF